MRNLTEGEIVPGRIIGITSNSVIVDVGYKSEGLIPIEEFTDRDGELSVKVGEEVDVLLEKTEDLEGHVLLSYTKAQRMRRWTEVERAYKEGRVIKGRVTDRIKGGLTVDVGLRAFLPGSLVDIKPVKNLESLRGQELEFKVISLDRRRNNIVLSRKAVLETELVKKKAETLKRLEEGARLRGHGQEHHRLRRVHRPRRHRRPAAHHRHLLGPGQPPLGALHGGRRGRGGGAQVRPRDRARLARLQAAQSTIPGRWSTRSTRSARACRAAWSRIVDYGAFVEIEEGVEGLIHVSEMSWTKKVVNPAKILEVGDEVEAIVSELDMDQRRISLSLRQTERNPWEELAGHPPRGQRHRGQGPQPHRVRRLRRDHRGHRRPDPRLRHELDQAGQAPQRGPQEGRHGARRGSPTSTSRTSGSRCRSRSSCPTSGRTSPTSHHPGDTLDGRVVNVTDFGLFIDIYNGLEGLAHVSEIERARRRQAGGPLQGRRLGPHPHPADRGGREEGRPLDARSVASPPRRRSRSSRPRPTPRSRRPRRRGKKRDLPRNPTKTKSSSGGRRNGGRALLPWSGGPPPP